VSWGDQSDAKGVDIEYRVLSSIAGPADLKAKSFIAVGFETACNPNIKLGAKAIVFVSARDEPKPKLTLCETVSYDKEFADSLKAAASTARGSTPPCSPKPSDLSQAQILAIAKAKLILPKAELEKTQFSIERPDGACGWSVVAMPPSNKPGSAVHLRVTNDGKKVEFMPSW
jgi:hypothetical protein